MRWGDCLATREYPKPGQHDGNSEMVLFKAQLQIGFEKPITLCLAGFGCDTAMSRETRVALRHAMRKLWSDPANTALVGCEAEIWGTNCKVLGFWIE